MAAQVSTAHADPDVEILIVENDPSRIEEDNEEQTTATPAADSDILNTALTYTASCNCDLPPSVNMINWAHPLLVVEYNSNKGQPLVFQGPPAFAGRQTSTLFKATLCLTQRVRWPFSDWKIVNPGKTETLATTPWEFAKNVAAVATRRSLLSRETNNFPLYPLVSPILPPPDEPGEQYIEPHPTPAVAPWTQKPWLHESVITWVRGGQKPWLILVDVTHFRRFGSLYKFEFLCSWRIDKQIESLDAHPKTIPAADHWPVYRCWVKLADLRANDKYYGLLLSVWDIETEKGFHFETDKFSRDADLSDLEEDWTHNRFYDHTKEEERAIESTRHLVDQEVDRAARKAQMYAKQPKRKSRGSSGRYADNDDMPSSDEDSENEEYVRSTVIKKRNRGGGGVGGNKRSKKEVVVEPTSKHQPVTVEDLNREKGLSALLFDATAVECMPSFQVKKIVRK
jgi:hypothetical protein